MGRKRTIDREATMVAIESVVRRHGVGGLSIDAVAKEAGISKSSVVYDFQNKAGLLAAFTSSRLAAHRAQLESFLPKDQAPNRWLRALLKASEETPTDEEVSVAMIISAAMSSEEECHSLMCQEINEVFDRVLSEADDPRTASLAYLALHGIKSLEFFGFSRFDPESRQKLLRDICWLVQAKLPSEPPAEHPACEPPQTDLTKTDLSQKGLAQTGLPATDPPIR